MTYLETKLRIKSWDEKPYLELPDGRKFTQATVELGGDAEGGDTANSDTEGSGTKGSGDTAGVNLRGTWSALMYYAPDGTSTYVGLMRLEGELAGRSGSFVLSGDGTFDGTRASGESVVVPGSGTADLSGISGTLTSVSTQTDYPFMPLTLDYQIG